MDWGIYQAIVNSILPSEIDRAKHMGIMNLAIGIPNTMAGLVAAAAVTGLGGYPGLYILAGGMAIVGGLVVIRIRAIR